MREMIARVRTVLDVDAAGLVDEYTHEPAARVHLAVDELVAQRGQRAFQQFVQLHRHDPKIERAKKNGLSSPFLLLIARHLTRKWGRLEEEKDPAACGDRNSVAPARLPQASAVVFRPGGRSASSRCGVGSGSGARRV